MSGRPCRPPGYFVFRVFFRAAAGLFASWPAHRFGCAFRYLAAPFRRELLHPFLDHRHRVRIFFFFVDITLLTLAIYVIAVVTMSMTSPISRDCSNIGRASTNRCKPPALARVTPTVGGDSPAGVNEWTFRGAISELAGRALRHRSATQIAWSFKKIARIGKAARRIRGYCQLMTGRPPQPVSLLPTQTQERRLNFVNFQRAAKK